MGIIHQPALVYKSFTFVHGVYDENVGGESFFSCLYSVVHLYQAWLLLEMF